MYISFLLVSVRVRVRVRVRVCVCVLCRVIVFVHEAVAACVLAGVGASIMRGS